MIHRFPRAAALCLSLAIPLTAQAVMINGSVRDANGNALPGVMVEAANAGGTAAAVTDSAGQFSLQVPEGAWDLTFRLLDFASVRRTVVVTGGSASSIDVTLPLQSTASIVVTGKRTFLNLADLDEPVNGLIGIADAASVGVITAAQIDARVEQRPGDVLESIPGVVISQHSGEGKANQYYLRGFNLDHGTDFFTTVAGAPVNMPTHGHGQGYADNNFLIPELISGVQYRKGPYYASEGDFSSAGSANVNYVSYLDAPMVSLTGGSFGYRRLFAAASTPWQNGQLLGAVELSSNDGPWDFPDDLRKRNGLVRFTSGAASSAWSLTLSGYDGRWNSTDQIPRRAVESKLIGRFGTIDPTDGGETSRWSAVGDWQGRGDRSLTKATAYLIDYDLELFSNFTYFLDDPENGDQFEQVDRRIVAGGRTSHQWFATLLGRQAENTIGLDLRHDRIREVGLHHTRRRERLETIRSDRVAQTSGGIYAQTTLQWNDRLRTVAGLRADHYRFDVRSDDPLNSGDASDSLLSPKLSVVLGPWRNTELYGALAGGFHSNDARGVTLTRDPATGEPAERVDPLVRTKGAEIGLRTNAIPRLQSTLAVWGLDVASELLFLGDAGTTEASRPSRRAGIEWSNYFRLADHLLFDADIAFSRARFRDDDPAGDRIPGAVERVASAGITLYDLGRISSSLRLRYLGPRPLVEDDSIRSSSSRQLQASVGYTITNRYRLVVEGLNLLDSRASDIDYFYTSRLPGEPSEGIDDVHFHPAEPRAVRVRFEVSF